MKREILFRGKRIDNGEWVEWFLVDSCYGLVLLPKLNNGETSLYHVDGNEWNVCSYEILPETIGQFTGLTDINGKEIFEGDIVRWVFEQHYWEAVISTVPNNKSNTLYAMETFHNCTTDDEGEFYTYKRSNSRNGSLNDIEYLSRECEVIGNIHDNPELLKP